MSGPVLYLDASAFLKLLVAEQHSAALCRALAGAELWSSVLLDVEAHRAARRLGLDEAVVTYNQRLADGCRAVALPLLQPR